MTLWFIIGLPAITALIAFSEKHGTEFINHLRIMAAVVTFLLVLCLPALLTPGYRTSVLICSFANMQLSLAMQFDWLAWIMLCLISGISLIVQAYSANYLISDSTQARFCGQLSALTASVMLLAVSGSLFTAFVAWQFIGITLYLLLNHYHYDAKANKAAKKKFIINRVGDICFLLAVLLAFAKYGNSQFDVLLSLPASETSSKTTILILIFIAIMTKSAQFPFHIWLPDTMEAPTPVSAMMHAGVINAGGFLLARLSPWLSDQTLLLNTIFLVGIITALLGSFYMLTQSDVKKQLAYSTMGQMGYMIMQCGLGCFAAAVFHLIAHSFYKATLFLESGSGLLNRNKKNNSPRHAYKYFMLAAILALMIASIGYGWLIWHNATNILNIVLWIFLYITLTQYTWAALTRPDSFKVKLGTVVLLLLVFLLYLWLFVKFNIFLNTIVLENCIRPSPWQIMLVLICLALSLYLMLNKNTGKTNFQKRIYLYSLNKDATEVFFRKNLLNPIRILGEKAYHIFMRWRTPQLKRLITAIAFLTISTFTLIGIDNWINGYSVNNNLVLWINLVVLTGVLLIANRAKTLSEVCVLIGLLTLSFSNLALFNGEKTTTLISLYHLINIGLLLLALILLVKRNTAIKPASLTDNRLDWRKFYLAILLLLMIGIPGTASFISEIYLLHGLLTKHIAVATLLAFAMLLLALVILHILQTYVFNNTPQSHLTTNVSPILHSTCWFSIAVNLWNGINPDWLLTHLLGVLK